MMESWNSVINTALLGTEKRVLKESDMDAALAESLALIVNQTTDREEAFLQIAAVVYNYRQCGFLPLQKESASIALAEDEDKKYASTLAHTVVDDVLETGSVSLLRFWLEACDKNSMVVQPEFVPTLFNAGVKTKSLQSLIVSCCGKRGEWLCSFNGDWKAYKTEGDDDVWQTGTLPQRKEFLTSLRKNDPTKARELLQEIWPQESAATKVELLQSFFVNASIDDLPWLEELVSEKSIKVKELALQLLKTIPSSSIIRRYEEVVKQSVQLTTSKGLLGIGSKTKLEIKLTGIDDALFASGIEQLPKDKGPKEETFILEQLIAAVPPNFWEAHFGSRKEDVIKTFLKSDEAKTFVLSLAKAAVCFKDTEWMRTIIAHDTDEFYPSAFTVLPQGEAETYALRFLPNKADAETIIQYLSSFPEEWSHAFTSAVLKHLARFPYQFHRSFYNENVQRFPISVLSEIEVITVPDAYAQQMWLNVSEHFKRLLSLKKQTQEAFNV